MRKLRISLLHLAPVTSDITHNRNLVESAVKVAAKEGADWAITPELCIPGYLFMKDIGVDWILPQPDEWMSSFCQLVKGLGLSVFLSHPELDTSNGNMYNTVFVIDQDGQIIGKHRKIKALRGAEAWSTGGTDISPVECDNVNAGILICADGYKNEVAEALKDGGAEILVSPVAWGPGTCGPDGEWEQRSLDTGLPIMVCNRTGVEPEELDYRKAESVVAQQGKRLLEATSERSVVLSFDWDMDAMTLLSKEFDRAYLD
jgi:predicted amidohydrolase